MGGDEEQEFFGSWELTPWWHWRYWKGYRVRRWNWWDGPLHMDGYYDGKWQYTTFENRAKCFLEETYGN
jgi:hypothetical protein